VNDDFGIKQIARGQQKIGGKNAANGAHQFLPLDTKHFKDLESKILDGLGDLDAVLDGELVHSENWQALNSLQKRYAGKVKCIYIDPPYNTGLSEIIYKNRNKHSTWLSLIENRLEISAIYQADDGVLVVAIDENQQESLGLVLSNLFPRDSKTTVTIVHNPSGQQGDNFSYCHDYACFIYKSDGGRQIGEEIRDEGDERNFRDVTGEQSKREAAKNCFYPIFVKDGKITGFGDICESDYHPGSVNIAVEDGAVAVFPVDPQGVERKWRFSRSTVEGISDELFPHYLKSRKVWDIKRRKNTFNFKTVWSDAKYSGNNHGTQLLNHIIGSQKFDYPKSINTVVDCLRAGLNKRKSAFVLDYFAGSGTTAHAVINLNREDGGSRKYLLVEMGEYFHTVLLPRIKKVIYSKDWKDGKPVSREGSGHFLKYYTLEQYEETLKNSHYQDGEQLELDSAKSLCEQYVFFADDKLAHAVKPKNGKLEINLKNLYPDIDIAESLSNILGKPIRHRTPDSVTFTDNTTEKTDPATMTEPEKRHFISLLRPYLWWGE